MKITNASRALQPAKEHRNSPRLKVGPLLYLHVAPDNGGFVLDIGDGGMGVSVANPLTVSTQISFSLTLDDQQLIQGIGQVCWITESGRKVGVRFLAFPDNALRRIKEWQISQEVVTKGPDVPPLTRKNMIPHLAPGQDVPGDSRFDHEAKQPDRQMARQTPTRPADAPPNNPSAPWAKEPAAPLSYSLLASPAPRPSAMPTEEQPSVPTSPGNDLGQGTSNAPLFFLPKPPGIENTPTFSSDDWSRPYSEKQKGDVGEDGDGESAALRTAVLSGSDSVERSKKRERKTGKVIWGTFFGAALISLAIFIYGYPGVFSGVRLRPARSGTVLTGKHVRKSGFRRLRRRGERTRVSERNELGNLPVQKATTFYVTQDEARFPAEVTVPLSRGSPTTSTRSSTALDVPSSGRSSDSSSSGSGRPSSTYSVSTSAGQGSVTEAGVGEPLRADGALVEEGMPVSTPLHVYHSGAVPKPIVVEAVIGADGEVKGVRLLSSPASRLAQAVIAAVKQWRYRPFYENGEPVEFKTRITFNFSLPAAESR